MDLGNILPGKTSKKDYYWSLVLESGWVQAGIWKIEDEKAQVESVSTAFAWEGDENLSEAVDSALTSAVQNLSEDEEIEPENTVFGVSSEWVEEGQIKPKYLEQIKKICNELSLTPVGFVVIPEALAHLYKAQEGVPLNAVLIGLGSESMEVTVFRLGSLQGNFMVARSVSVADDVVEGLSRFVQSEPLPTRIILYDGREAELEDAKQTLLNTNWDEKEKIKFLHAPNVEVVKPNYKVLATALAGGSEISGVSSVFISGEEQIESETQPTLNREEIENLAPVGQEDVTPEDLGFVVGEDVAQTQPPEISHVKPTAIPEKEAQPSFSQEVEKPKQKISLLSANFKNKLRIKKPQLPKFSKRPLILISVIGFLFLAGLFAAWWYLPKASVLIYVAPKKIEDTIKLTINTANSSNDFANSEINGEVISKEETSDNSKTTTGTKIIGEKATGSVKVQNGTATAINLQKGTVLSSEDGLKFTLDSQASVSAALSPSSPGTTEVNVAAYAIGSEYNLSKDVSLKVGNYPKADVDATILDDFTGGSSREISAVSASDQESLEKDLTDEIVQKTLSDLDLSIATDKYLVEGSQTSEVVSRDFSNKVGDEADNLKLSLTLKVSAVIVDKQSFYDFLKQKMAGKVPSNFVLRDEQLAIDFKDLSNEDSLYKLDTLVSANLLPQTDIDQIKSQIKGKSPSVAENYLNSIEGFQHADIKLKPRLFGFLRALPHVSNNISIQIESQH